MLNFHYSFVYESSQYVGHRSVDASEESHH